MFNPHLDRCKIISRIFLELEHKQVVKLNMLLGHLDK